MGHLLWFHELFFKPRITCYKTKCFVRAQGCVLQCRFVDPCLTISGYHLALLPVVRKILLYVAKPLSLWKECSLFPGSSLTEGLWMPSKTMGTKLHGIPKDFHIHVWDLSQSTSESIFCLREQHFP